MDNLLADLRSSASQQQLLWHESGRTRPHYLRIASSGGRFYLGPAKNDHDALHRRKAAVQSEHDVVDDAHIPGGILPELAKRVASILGNLQLNWNFNSIFYYRMGAALPIVPQG